MKKPKLIIMGHARHGKDTVSEMLRDRYGFSFTSSSEFCAEHVVFPRMTNLYNDHLECFADRANHRAEWFEAIRDFNDPDLTALGRAILDKHDMYCGIRNHSEFHALRIAKVFDFAIWVDASRRKDPEPRSSCTVEPWMADFVLDNNGTLDNLAFNLESLYKHQLSQ